MVDEGLLGNTVVVAESKSAVLVPDSIKVYGIIEACGLVETLIVKELMAVLGRNSDVGIVGIEGCNADAGVGSTLKNVDIPEFVGGASGFGGQILLMTFLSCPC